MTIININHITKSFRSIHTVQDRLSNEIIRTHTLINFLSAIKYIEGSTFYLI